MLLERKKEKLISFPSNFHAIVRHSVKCFFEKSAIANSSHLHKYDEKNASSKKNFFSLIHMIAIELEIMIKRELRAFSYYL